MRIHRFIAAGLVLTALCALHAPARVARADAAPLCYDNALGTTTPATQWLTAPGTLNGTSGNDVLVGSTGSDVIKGNGGNDLICTAPYPQGVGAPDTVTGGLGDDFVAAYYVGTANGGSGNDVVYGTGVDANGGPGNDEVIIDGLGGYGTGDGGSGNDYVHGFNDPAALLGSSGNDDVANTSGDPLIDCGSGRDRVSANGATVVKSCESTFTPV